MLTQEQMRALLDYDPDTGMLTWLHPLSSRVQAGDTATSLRADGYTQVGVRRKRYMAHRLAWLYMTGEFPIGSIDHIDGCRTNNSWSNLRLATSSLNAQNLKRAHGDNKFGFLGVSFIVGRKSRPYRSEIRHQGKQIFLGTFPTPEEAHAAYLKAKRQLHEGNTL